jgi:hypothetical protein
MVLFRRGMHFGSYGTVDDGPAVFDRLAEAVRIPAIGAILADAFPASRARARRGRRRSAPSRRCAGSAR